jgi:hypothetical protein
MKQACPVVFSGQGKIGIRHIIRQPFRIEQHPSRRVGMTDCVGNVLRRGDKARTLLNEVIAPLGARVERGTGDGEDVAVLLEGQPCGDERAGALGGFHDHDTKRESGYQPVTAGEVAGAGLPAHGHFGEECAALVENIPGERDIVLGIDPVEAACKNGDGAGGQAGAMGGGIDPPREARDDDEAQPA